MRIKWARCLIDFGWHAIDQDCDHPPDVLLAECGHLLPMVQLWDQPYGVACGACAALQVGRAEGEQPDGPSSMSAPSGQARRRDLDGAALLSELATDFVAAARLLWDGLASAAMVKLVPLHLTERELAFRVYLMIVAGVLATAPLGRAAVQDLIAAGHAEPVDLLVDLVGLFARLDRGAGC